VAIIEKFKIQVEVIKEKKLPFLDVGSSGPSGRHEVSEWSVSISVVLVSKWSARSPPESTPAFQAPPLLGLLLGSLQQPPACRTNATSIICLPTSHPFPSTLFLPTGQFNLITTWCF